MPPPDLGSSIIGPISLHNAIEDGGLAVRTRETHVTAMSIKIDPYAIMGG
jgi:hypothetical protein